MGDKELKKVVRVLFMVNTWYIWKHRNQVLFKKTTPSVTGVLLDDVLALATVWLSTRSRRGGDEILRNMPHDLS